MRSAKRKWLKRAEAVLNGTRDRNTFKKQDKLNKAISEYQRRTQQDPSREV